MSNDRDLADELIASTLRSYAQVTAVFTRRDIFYMYKLIFNDADPSEDKVSRSDGKEMPLSTVLSARHGMFAGSLKLLDVIATLSRTPGAASIRWNVLSNKLETDYPNVTILKLVERIKLCAAACLFMSLHMVYQRNGATSQLVGRLGNILNSRSMDNVYETLRQGADAWLHWQNYLSDDDMMLRLKRAVTMKSIPTLMGTPEIERLPIYDTILMIVSSKQMMWLHGARLAACILVPVVYDHYTQSVAVKRQVWTTNITRLTDTTLANDALHVLADVFRPPVDQRRVYTPTLESHVVMWCASDYFDAYYKVIFFAHIPQNILKTNPDFSKYVKPAYKISTHFEQIRKVGSMGQQLITLIKQLGMSYTGTTDADLLDRDVANAAQRNISNSSDATQLAQTANLPGTSLAGSVACTTESESG